MRLDYCAGYSRCLRDGDIALATADAHGRRPLRWLQRMHVEVEHCAGNSECPQDWSTVMVAEGVAKVVAGARGLRRW